jgi:transcriptional regulator with XRE-family HTH domain
MEFKDKLKYLRKLRKLTQQELGDKCGINREMITKYESGALPEPTVRTLKKLCKALECKSGQLLGF